MFSLPGSQNIGVMPTERDGAALIIDTGLSEDTARRLLRALDLARLRPAAILNTHAHADHFGGNAWLVRRAGVPVYAPVYEEAFMRYPRLEAVGLSRGPRPSPRCRATSCSPHRRRSITWSCPAR